MPPKVSVMRGWGLAPVGSSFMTTRRPGIGVQGGGAGEERGGVAVGAEAEVEHVELAELAERSWYTGRGRPRSAWGSWR